ncbi:DNA-processing protein DprA [Actinoplanes sp. NPDC023714]|uniref:DNA-processing protein DprA n=1 Tax=Actinoplanes sp. NPDC023714 TaxID=3154322 RepID=UPI0033FFDDA8
MTTGLEQIRIARAVLTYIAVCLPSRAEKVHELAVTLGPVDAVDMLLSPDLPAESRDYYLGAIPVQRVRAYAAEVLDAAEDAGARILIPEDEGWPARLDDLSRVEYAAASSSALCLWVRGTQGSITARTVALCGSRAATPYGTAMASEFGHSLASSGWIVATTSGFGIAHAALRGALAARGSMVVVLAGGIDRLHPPKLTSVLTQVSRNGLLVTAYPPGTEPTSRRAAEAGRLLAGISSGTVLIEAALRSTSLASLEEAVRRGRHAMVMPGPVTSAQSAGAHQALRRNPQARLIHNVEDVLTELAHVR